VVTGVVEAGDYTYIIIVIVIVIIYYYYYHHCWLVPFGGGDLVNKSILELCRDWVTTIRPPSNFYISLSIY
jgi:hypothetical protein